MGGDIAILVGAALAAGGVGAVVARLRPDLGLGARAVGVCAAAAAAAFGGAALGLGYSWTLAAILALVCLAPLAVIDLRRRILPDPLTAILALGGLALAYGDGRLIEAAFAGAIGFGAIWGFGALWRALRGVEALGFGDAKLVGAIAVLVGWRALPEVILVAALIGLAYGALAAIIRSGAPAGRVEIAFGPALAISAWVQIAAGPLLFA